MFENIHGTVAHILVLPLPTHNVVALGTNSTQELTSISQPDHHHHHHHHYHHHHHSVGSLLFLDFTITAITHKKSKPCAI